MVLREIIRNRKGLTAYNMIIMIMRIVFLVIALLSIVIIISIAVNVNLETKESESVLLIARLMYSPEGLSQVDPITGRVVTGVIAVDQMNATRLDNGIYIKTNNRIAARAELYEYTLTEGDDPIANFVKVVKFNGDVFDSYDPLAEGFLGTSGIGGVYKYETKYPVIVLKEDGSRSLGYMSFKVLIPKSAQ